MKCKMIEVRDRMTCIPALAMKMVPQNEVQRAFYKRTGYNEDSIVLMRLADQEAHSDPYDWPDARTMGHAHDWLQRNWDSVTDGQVLDVRVVLGEEPVAADPEIWAPDFAR